jgi:cbb3-type cytochrome oxidase subunit 3
MNRTTLIIVSIVIVAVGYFVYSQNKKSQDTNSAKVKTAADVLGTMAGGNQASMGKFADGVTSPDMTLGEKVAAKREAEAALGKLA